MPPAKNSLLSDYNEENVLRFLKEISDQYPRIEEWFIDKVNPGLATGTREIFCRYKNGKLIAVGIAKNEADEQKICTLRVSQGWRGLGIGTSLLDEMVNWLGNDLPLITIPREKQIMFGPIFDRFNFQLSREVPNLYCLGTTELIYNEKL